jgi:hypothetical protein
MSRILLGGDSRTWVKIIFVGQFILDLGFFSLLTHSLLKGRVNFPPLGRRFVKGGLVSRMALLGSIGINIFDVIVVTMLVIWHMSVGML